MTRRDTEARARALDPAQSFIVQAPAGSGKTELLIQRVLRLLALVDQPEQILAITFTRKAAGEMRDRVCRALAEAAAGHEPDSAHRRISLSLARDALDRDARQGWSLLEQPQRLRIQTIDAVNAALTRTTPLSAGFSSSYKIAEQPGQLYARAARATLEMAADPGELGDAVGHLLALYDNRADRIETLLSDMLARRDIWLAPVVAAGSLEWQPLHESITIAWRARVSAALGVARKQLSDPIEQMAASLLSAIAESDDDTRYPHWAESTTALTSSAADLPQWRELAALLLTSSGHWRKRLDKSVGVPATGAPELRQAASKLLSAVRDQDNGLETALANISDLPPPPGEADVAAVRAALVVLPHAVAELKAAFRARREKDYTEAAHEALASLGDDERPTDVALRLDYAIRHILIDEFQDTSRAQFQLLQRLTAGWSADADSSLFIVGDPMQSIYRFRQADARLFGQVVNNGVGALPLEHLTLTANFRSQPAIVDWVNETFTPRADAPAGLSAFAPGDARQSAIGDAGVTWHLTTAADEQVESVIDVVQTHVQAERGSLGILVRSREHARPIMRGLRNAGIPYAAPEFQRLVDQPAVQDVLALSRSLLHLGDRLAWLSVLRAPWCGLSLRDLHALATFDLDATIWSTLNNSTALAGVSDESQCRLDRVVPALRAGLNQRGSIPLRDVVEYTWRKLSGPATLGDALSARHVDRFLDHLAAVEQAGDIADPALLGRELDDVFLADAAQDAVVRILTIHKAKGLEFDTVIVPSLERPAASGTVPLLLIDDNLVNSPPLFSIGAGTREENVLGNYLWQAEREQEALELDRLIYVATTRARRRLHLAASVTDRAPASRSLLGRLWSRVTETQERSAGGSATAPETNEPDWCEVAIRRLPAGHPLERGAEHWLREDQSGTDEPVEFTWAAETAAIIGQVVHHWLQHLAKRELARRRVDIDAHRGLIRTQLTRLGVTDEKLEEAVNQVSTALANTMLDDAGQWILFGDHTEADSELRLYRHDEESGSQLLIVDRTFVDAKGQRWIIDYKTGRHEGGLAEEFVAREADRYRSQLRAYRDALRALDDRPLRTALYFPLLTLLREVDVDQSEPDIVN